MMKAVLLATCVTCLGAVALKDAAISQGYDVEVEKIMKSDERTATSAELGIGLPVLIRDNHLFSDDAKTWIDSEKKNRTKVTHPLKEVVDNANTDFIE